MLRLLALGFLVFVPKEVQKQIQAQYDRWSKAYMANDVDTLLGILSPDYTLTNSNKEVMTYATYKAYIKLRAKGPKEATQYRTRILSLSVHGDVADADSVESMTTGRTVHRHEYHDTWSLRGGVWRLSKTVTVKESTTTIR
jgi:hypothetical protein